MKIRQKILMALMVLTSTVWASSKKTIKTNSFSNNNLQNFQKNHRNFINSKIKVQPFPKKASSQTPLSPAAQKKIDFLKKVLISSKQELEKLNKQTELINLIFSALPNESIPQGSTITALLKKL